MWRQNYQNLPSKARYIKLKVWRQKFENFLGKARYSSFVLDTFHIMYLNIPSLGQKFEIWKYRKFCPPHYSLDTPSSGRKKSFHVLTSTILKTFFKDLKFLKYHKFCPPHFSFDTPSSGQKKSFYVLSSTILKLFSSIWNLKISQVLCSTLFIWNT